MCDFLGMRLKGMGWGGPPIKRPKRKALAPSKGLWFGCQENRDVTPAQQMRLEASTSPLVCWLRQLYTHGGVT